MSPLESGLTFVCEKYINAAENLAREAEEMAKYHEMRAKEVEGK